MPNFFYSFEGGRMPSSNEEGEASMKAWNAWTSGLGDALVDGGGPVGKSKTVSGTGTSDGGGAEPLMGYSIVSANSIDDAIAMLKNCPHFEFGGTVEVAEIIKM